MSNKFRFILFFSLVPQQKNLRRLKTEQPLKFNSIVALRCICYLRLKKNINNYDENLTYNILK